MTSLLSLICDFDKSQKLLSATENCLQNIMGISHITLLAFFNGRNSVMNFFRTVEDCLRAK